MKTPRVPIESLWLGLYDGPHATPKPSDDGPIFLGIGNLTEEGSLDLADVRHIAEEDFGNWTKRVVPQAGDIVFTYEATLNRYAMIPEGFRGCLGRRLALIRPDSSKANPRFLFFYFFGKDWRETISRNILSGATVDRIPLTKFPTFEVNLPSRHEQDRIAEILSAYDDLIENNTRRIKILEEMAQMTYREWFVNFRFPGHEQIEMAQTAVGVVPVGWCQPFPDYVDYLEGPGLRKWEFRNKGIPFLNVRNLVGHDIETSESHCVDVELGSGKYRHFLLAEGDHVVSSSGTLGRIATVRKRHLPVMLNTGIIRMRPKTGAFGKWLIKHFLQSEYFQKQIRAYAMGVAQIHFGPSHLRQMKAIVPSEEIGQKYEALVDPMESLLCSLVENNKNLRTTRDMLLPKLVSGEVRVEQIETEVAALSA